MLRAGDRWALAGESNQSLADAETRVLSGFRLNQAAGVGFEPTGDLSAASGFQDRPIRPLWHPAGQASLGGAPNCVRTSGTAISPPSSWKFSSSAITQRAVIAVPFSVCTGSSFPSRRKRMPSRRAW